MRSHLNISRKVGKFIIWMIVDEEARKNVFDFYIRPPKMINQIRGGWVGRVAELIYTLSNEKYGEFTNPHERIFPC